MKTSNSTSTQSLASFGSMASNLKELHQTWCLTVHQSTNRMNRLHLQVDQQEMVPFFNGKQLWTNVSQNFENLFKQILSPSFYSIQYLALILPPAAIKKVANAKSVAEKAAVLKETVGESDFCAQTPVQWIRKFESMVRSCFPDTIETEMETFFMAYLPYMLNLKHRGWFFNVRNAEESWVDFKKKFSAHFWTKFWNFAENTFQNEPETDESLLVFVKAEIERIKQLIPGLSEKATIMMCILSLPNQTRPLLQDGLSESLEMFLSMVEAVDC